MAIITCWAAKGGSGTTVVAAGLALATDHPSVIVDLAGDQAAVLGLPEPLGQGLSEWFASDAAASSIVDLAVDVGVSTVSVHRGASPIRPDADRWGDLATWMANDHRLFVIDAGTTSHLAPALLTGGLDDGAAVTDLLVTRPCYLSLRRASAAPTRPSGVVLVNDGGHVLGRSDVARSVGAPIVAELRFDPAVSRAVDAGLLVFSPPGSFMKPLRRVVLEHLDIDRSPSRARLTA